MSSVRSILELLAVAGRNAILGANIASLPLLLHPKRFVTYCSEALFLYKTFSNSRGLHQKNVFEVLPCSGDVRIVLGSFGDAGDWFCPTASYTADIVSLCLICQVLRPQTVFEIGTMRGYTALHFALNTPTDTVVYTLDLPVDRRDSSHLRTTAIDDSLIARRTHVDAYCFDGDAAESKIRCLYGDSATFDFSVYHDTVNFFFIDGAHSYEYVRSDTLSALKCCRSGGVIAWHDFGRAGVNGVSRWLRELSRTRRIYSVPGGSLAFTLVD